jgi:hypothetical protein
MPDAKTIYQTLEQEYETTRLAVAAGKAKQSDLERIAQRTTDAAQVLAIQRGWVLPELNLWQQ